MDFKIAYDKELETVDEGSFEWEVLNLRQIRAFMYEVYKRAVEDSHSSEIDPQNYLTGRGSVEEWGRS